MYEYKMTGAAIPWSKGEPDFPKVIAPEGDGWELVSSAATGSESVDAIYWTWRREEIDPLEDAI